MKRTIANIAACKLSLFLFLVGTSCCINAQVTDSITDQNKEVQTKNLVRKKNAVKKKNVVKNNVNCPVKVKDWKNYQIDLANDESYRDCIDWLSSVYMQGKVLSYMDQKEIQGVLVDRYKDLIKYYEDPDGGLDMDIADEFREELDKVKGKKPAKSK